MQTSANYTKSAKKIRLRELYDSTSSLVCLEKYDLPFSIPPILDTAEKSG